jgi:hypothetical protein
MFQILLIIAEVAMLALAPRCALPLRAGGWARANLIMPALIREG